MKILTPLKLFILSISATTIILLLTILASSATHHHQASARSTPARTLVPDETSAPALQPQMDDDTPAYDQARLPIYIDTVKNNPHDPQAWSSLAYILRDDPKGLGQGETATIDGKSYNKRECYVKSLNLDSDAKPQSAVWYNLGTALSGDLDNDFVTVQGKKYNKLNAFVKAVEIDPKAAALPWYNIGTIMGEKPQYFKKTKGKVLVKGIATSQLQCYANALGINPRLPYAWNNVGTSLPDNKATITIDGAKFTNKQCFIEELENNIKHGSAWMNLATTLETGKDFAVIDDVKYDKKKCLLNSIRYSPTLPGAWHNLGTILHPRDNITVTIDANPQFGFKKKKKVVVNAIRCEEAALKLDPRLAVAWFGAGTKMKDDDILEVPDAPSPSNDNNNRKNNNKKNKNNKKLKTRKYTKRDAYLKAIELEPNWADPWNNLATVVEKDETITLDFLKSDKKEFTQKDLLIESINREPEIGRTWHNLCSVMSEDETVTVDGGVYTKTGCKARADEIKNTVKARPGEEE